VKFNNIPEPSEHDQQCSIFRWAKLMEYPGLALLYAIPNGGFRHKATAKRLKDEGVKAGVPDICLPVACGGYYGLYIELKKKSNNFVTVNQEEWLERLRGQNYYAVVCRGEDSAKQTIIGYLEGRLDK